MLEWLVATIFTHYHRFTDDKKRQETGRGHESDDSDRPKKKAPAKAKAKAKTNGKR